MNAIHVHDDGTCEEYDCEPVSAIDRSCDYCGKTIYRGALRPVTMAGATSWLCDACHQRQERRYQEATAVVPKVVKQATHAFIKKYRRALEDLS